VSRPRSTSTERERSRRRLLAFWRAFALGTLGLLTVHERSHALGELGLLRVGLLLGEVAGGDLLVDAGADVRDESVDDRLRVDNVGLLLLWVTDGGSPPMITMRHQPARPLGMAAEPEKRSVIGR